jgi:hypothetical protein
MVPVLAIAGHKVEAAQIAEGKLPDASEIVLANQ